MINRLGVCLALLATSVTATQQPNLVFIMADDLGWKDVEYAGAVFFETPNIDQLASAGKVFSEAYSSGPNCSPTRATLMSGTYSPRHQIFTPGGESKGKLEYMRLLVPAVEQDDAALAKKASELIPYTASLAPEFVCIPEILKTVGYTSARLGKWHLGEDAQGFDLSSSDGVGGPQEKFEFYSDIDMAERLTNRALAFIDDNREGPFFLYLSHWDVHVPMVAREGVVKKYEEKLGKIPKKERRNFDPVYAASLEAVDISVGRVVAKIDELGLSENTLIIFTSDNGGLPSYSQLAPLRGCKGSLLEGGIRVPAVMRWTGTIAPGSHSDVPFSSVDYLPTFAALAGAELPVTQPVDGMDISPLLYGRPLDGGDRPIFWHYPLYLSGGTGFEAQLPNGKGYVWRGVPTTSMRRGDYKLIEFHADNRVELYNLKQDPSELRNLAASQPERASRMHAELNAWQAAVGAPVSNVPNPAYRLGEKPLKAIAPKN